MAAPLTAASCPSLRPLAGLQAGAFRARAGFTAECSISEALSHVRGTFQLPLYCYAELRAEICAATRRRAPIYLLRSQLAFTWPSLRPCPAYLMLEIRCSRSRRGAPARSPSWTAFPRPARRRHHSLLVVEQPRQCIGRTTSNLKTRQRGAILCAFAHSSEKPVLRPTRLLASAPKASMTNTDPFYSAYVSSSITSVGLTAS